MNIPLTEHIAAGQLKTLKDANLVMQAYLGTCLGVAIYDPFNKIGGLIHILLPEPPGSFSSDSPEKYAVTGVPLLIKSLVELGSHPANMRATIAGGALVGPVSRQDMGLDIGGRSAEIAQDILKRHKIQVITSETGGFFTCTLTLDMGTGEASITPAWDPGSPLVTAPVQPNHEQILHTISTLKPIPQTALKILRMVQDIRFDMEDVTRELAQDQVLSAQTLKLCNSALFSGTLRIDTLKDAVLLLGQDTLVKTIIAAAVNQYYAQTGSSGYSLCRGGLFFHAVGVAKAAEFLAEKTGKVSSQQAYTAGLLHDIGKVVLDQFVSDSAPLLFRNLKNESETFLNAEQKILGITHCATGAILAKKWQFSGALNQVIRYHHLPEAADDHKDLVDIVYLADLVMEKFFTGFDIERMQTRSIRSVLKRLGLTLDHLWELIDAMPVNELNQPSTPNGQAPKQTGTDNTQ